MRRRAHVVVVTLLVSVGSLGATSCGAPDQPYATSSPTVNLAAKVVLEVDETGIVARPGPRHDGSVELDPLRLPQGSVIEIRNTGTAEHRLRADDLFDTGTIHPGDTVVVALTKDTATDTSYDVADRANPDLALPLTIRPRPDPT